MFQEDFRWLKCQCPKRHVQVIGCKAHRLDQDGPGRLIKESQTKNHVFDYT